MDPRHHHHGGHNCHLKHQHGSHGTQASFERYGGFPHLSRIFPPLSSSSSTTSSTDSDIRVSKRFRFHRRWCACVFIAVLFVAIGAAVGIYCGYQFLNLKPQMDQLFRGSFTVKKGDSFKRRYGEPDSPEFYKHARKYKKIIDDLYASSVVKNAYLGSEILAFEGVENGPFSVYFNVNIDTHRIRVDAGDLFIVLADTLRNSKGVLKDDIIVDLDSLEIQERSIAFLYLPSTERNFIPLMNEETSKEKERDPMTSSSSKKNEHKMPKIVFAGNVPNRQNDSIRIDSYDQKDNAIVVTTEKEYNSKQCKPMTVDFCTNLTNSKMQKKLDDAMLLQMAVVVESGCYPFAAHFLCDWSLACRTDDLLPCKDYCDEFISNCGHKLTKEMKNALQCGKQWKGKDSCQVKPGCVQKIYDSGHQKRLCDGTMDCIDFSDELHCPYCPPGFFHCGAGKECIEPNRKCDGVQDCSNNSDEKSCLTLAPSSEAAGYVHQYFNEGYLFVHDQGRLGKLCVERNDSKTNSLWETESQLLLDNIGSSACELLGFRKVAFVRIQPDSDIASPQNDKVASSYVRIQEPASSSEVTFNAGSCPSKKVLYVGCNHLECGKRPSHQRSKKSQFAGHGDWPWHVALFKNNEHVCDATLVTSQWLLTSDECFQGKTKAKWIVHFGRVRMSSMSPWQQERRVVGMVKSPLGDNLVLIKMASPVIFSDFARHICLPDEPNGITGFKLPNWDRTNGKCVRLGWSKKDELTETKMHQLGPESCRQTKLVKGTNTTQLCFENDPPGRDCLKEIMLFPGAPVYCKNEETDEWALAGISSKSQMAKCGIEKYRVSSVAGSTEWILKTIEALSNIV